MQSPSASYSLTVRLEITNKPGMLGQVTSAIGKAGGDIGAIDLVQVGKSTITRDLTFKARDEPHGQQIVERIRGVARRQGRERLRPHLPHAPRRQDRGARARCR